VRWAKQKYKRLRRHTHERNAGWCASHDANQPCSLTGGLWGPTAGQWELGESRGSRRVSESAGGWAPSGQSPCRDSYQGKLDQDADEFIGFAMDCAGPTNGPHRETFAAYAAGRREMVTALTPPLPHTA
jgi:hypothetical protein